MVRERRRTRRAALERAHSPLYRQAAPMQTDSGSAGAVLRRNTPICRGPRRPERPQLLDGTPRCECTGSIQVRRGRSAGPRCSLRRIASSRRRPGVRFQPRRLHPTAPPRGGRRGRKPREDLQAQNRPPRWSDAHRRDRLKLRHGGEKRSTVAALSNELDLRRLDSARPKSGGRREVRRGRNVATVLSNLLNFGKQFPSPSPGKETRFVLAEDSFDPVADRLALPVRGGRRRSTSRLPGWNRGTGDPRRRICTHGPSAGLGDRFEVRRRDQVESAVFSTVRGVRSRRTRGDAAPTLRATHRVSRARRRRSFEPRRLASDDAPISSRTSRRRRRSRSATPTPARRNGTRAAA